MKPTLIRPTAAQTRQAAWVQTTGLPPALRGKRRGTRRHVNRLRSMRLGIGRDARRFWEL